MFDKIPKNTLVYIVGHSLGGWNGAQLTSELAEEGIRTEMLITLDPVGDSILTALFFDVYWRDPTVSANYWVNIRAKPKSEQRNTTDLIGDIGFQWDALESRHKPDLSQH